MRVRNVVTRSGRGYRGYLPSKKLNRRVQFESLLELHAALILEFSPGVIRYQEQPELIHYEIDGAIRSYVPDFEVELVNHKLLHLEVKPEAKLRTATLQKKFSSINIRYLQHPAQFMVLTDREIKAEPLYSNLELLFRGLQNQQDISSQTDPVIDFLHQHPFINYSQLIDQFGRQLIVTMLARRELVVDLTRNLNEINNLVRVYEESDDATLLF